MIEFDRIRGESHMTHNIEKYGRSTVKQRLTRLLDTYKPLGVDDYITIVPRASLRGMDMHEEEW